jgi:thymidylate synthase (FAD)
LPVSFYTQWYWKVDLHNLLNFLTLRTDEHAQHEIRQYALIILDMVKLWVPHTYEAFVDYQLEGLHLSRGALDAVRRMIRGDVVDAASCGLSAREWTELMAGLQGSSDPSS